MELHVSLLAFFSVALFAFAENGGDADSDVALSRMASYVTKGRSFWCSGGASFFNVVDWLAFASSER